MNRNAEQLSVPSGSVYLELATRYLEHGDFDSARALIFVEVRGNPTLDGCVMHAQNCSCERGEADEDQRRSRVMGAARPAPGQLSRPELIFAPRSMREVGSQTLSAQFWESVAVGPTGTALCKPTN
jgi:hypothetical protein